MAYGDEMLHSPHPTLGSRERARSSNPRPEPDHEVASSVLDTSTSVRPGQALTRAPCAQHRSRQCRRRGPRTRRSTPLHPRCRVSCNLVANRQAQSVSPPAVRRTSAMQPAPDVFTARLETATLRTGQPRRATSATLPTPVTISSFRDSSFRSCARGSSIPMSRYQQPCRAPDHRHVGPARRWDGAISWYSGLAPSLFDEVVDGLRPGSSTCRARPECDQQRRPLPHSGASDESSVCGRIDVGTRDCRSTGRRPCLAIRGIIGEAMLAGSSRRRQAFYRPTWPVFLVPRHSRFERSATFPVPTRLPSGGLPRWLLLLCFRAIGSANLPTTQRDVPRLIGCRNTPLSARMSPCCDMTFFDLRRRSSSSGDAGRPHCSKVAARPM